MCELLVRAIDKTNADPWLDAQCTKRGDVIVIVDDGHRWGPGELQDRQYIIVRAPGVPASKASAYLAPERGDDQFSSNPGLRARGFYMDLDASCGAPQPKSLGDLLALKRQKTPGKNPLFL